MKGSTAVTNEMRDRARRRRVRALPDMLRVLVDAGELRLEAAERARFGLLPVARDLARR